MMHFVRLVPAVVGVLVIVAIAVVVLLPFRFFVSIVGPAVVVLVVAVVALLKRSPALVRVIVIVPVPVVLKSFPVVMWRPHGVVRFSPAVLCILKVLGAAVVLLVIPVAVVSIVKILFVSHSVIVWLVLIVVYDGSGRRLMRRPGIKKAKQVVPASLLLTKTNL